MASPWKAIDKLCAQYKVDKARAEHAVKEAKATRLKALDTNIWKCRFRPFRSAPVDVRGRGAAELIEELDRLTKERVDARETARKAREEERRAQREDDRKVRAALRALGAKKIRVSRVGEPPRVGRWWSCTVRLNGEVREFEARPCEVLLVDVRHAVEKG